jgi:hypothetical protein
MDADIFGIWSTADEVFENFTTPKSEREGVEILFAVYWSESYDGSAFVLYRKDGELYAVEGSHCSCYGLEDQWSPVKVTKESLVHEIEKGELGQSRYDEDGNFGGRLLEFLKKL